MSIEVSNLLKEYGTQKAVNNISFRAGKGEIVGFLGPNGAGKSTTMKIITGYLQPTAGEARVCGISVAENPLETRKKIGYLAELNALYYDMYVREYLSFLAGVHGLPDKNQAVERVIDIVGLRPEARKKIGQLSKGFKQRVGLAAALIHDPEVLILDEPTTGLDPNQIVEIREVIRRQGFSKTVLFSSHILQEVEAICDRVIIIHKGSLVADDTLSNLRKKSSTGLVTVRFGEKVERALIAELPALSEIISEEANNWQLATPDADQLRKQILSLALQHNFNIVSLHSENQRLEDIFRSLTAAASESPALQ